MPFDEHKWAKPVTGGDLGGVALDVSIALRQIHEALEKLNASSGADIKEELILIEKARKDVWKAFESLTGWTRQQ